MEFDKKLFLRHHYLLITYLCTFVPNARLSLALRLPT